MSSFTDALSIVDGNFGISNCLGSKEKFFQLVKEFEKVM